MKSFAATALLAGLAIAGPILEKRRVTTKEIIETVWSTTTVWIDPTAAPSNIFAEYNVGGSSSGAVPTPSSVSVPAAPVVTPSPVAQPQVENKVIPSSTPQVQAQPSQAASSGSGVSAGSPPAGSLHTMTYYDLNMGTTSCGGQYTNQEFVVALRPENMPNTGNPNTSPSCGRQIQITTASGNTAVGKVVDTCPTCTSVNDIDVSPALMEKLVGSGYVAAGIAQVSWVWL